MFQIFVVNRVSAILDQSTAAQWRYVESTLNLADKASRGITVDELLTNEHWKQGPLFLKKVEQFWPQIPENLGEISDSNPEVKKGVEIFANKASVACDYIGNAIEKISSWSSLKEHHSFFRNLPPLNRWWLWDRADLDTSFSYFEKSSPQLEIKVHLEFCINLSSVLLDFQSFTEKPVFECVFTHPIMFFIIFG